ncbi:MAG TPA: hypothetical protein VKR32_10330 [Puia sp.]|nr:hypothetical protein [Puia sp.]
MDTISALLAEFGINAAEAIGIALVFTSIGYYRGRRKSAKLQKQIHLLEDEIIELNAELLYPENSTKVIALKNAQNQNEKKAN